MMRVFDVLLNSLSADVACRTEEVALTPKAGQLFEVWKLLSQVVGTPALKRLSNKVNGVSRIHLNKQVEMVRGYL